MVAALSTAEDDEMEEEYCNSEEERQMRAIDDKYEGEEITKED